MSLCFSYLSVSSLSASSCITDHLSTPSCLIAPSPSPSANLAQSKVENVCRRVIAHGRAAAAKIKTERQLVSHAEFAL